MPSSNPLSLVPDSHIDDFSIEERISYSEYLRRVGEVAPVPSEIATPFWDGMRTSGFPLISGSEGAPGSHVYTNYTSRVGLSGAGHVYVPGSPETPHARNLQRSKISIATWHEYKEAAKSDLINGRDALVLGHARGRESRIYPRWAFSLFKENNSAFLRLASARLFHQDRLALWTVPCSFFSIQSLYQFLFPISIRQEDELAVKQELKEALLEGLEKGTLKLSMREFNRDFGSSSNEDIRIKISRKLENYEREYLVDSPFSIGSVLSLNEAITPAGAPISSVEGDQLAIHSIISSSPKSKFGDKKRPMIVVNSRLCCIGDLKEDEWRKIGIGEEDDGYRLPLGFSPGRYRSLKSAISQFLIDWAPLGMTPQTMRKQAYNFIEGELSASG